MELKKRRRSARAASQRHTGERMATWCFKTAALNERSSSRHLWYWQVDTQSTLLLTAIKLFANLEECVADARAHGFKGVLQLPPEVLHPASVTWSDEAQGEARPAADQRVA